MGDILNKKNCIIIAAVSENMVIGKNGKIPWHLPHDLKRFKVMTTGSTIIMGRKTYESLGSRPLPERQNIVVSSTLQNGVDTCSTFESAIHLAKYKDIYAIGGREIYKAAMPYCTRLELTRVHVEIPVDNNTVLFPDIDLSGWELHSTTMVLGDANHEYSFSYETYLR